MRCMSNRISNEKFEKGMTRLASIFPIEEPAPGLGGPKIHQSSTEFTAGQDKFCIKEDVLISDHIHFGNWTPG